MKNVVNAETDVNDDNIGTYDNDEKDGTDGHGEHDERDDMIWRTYIKCKK